MSKHHKLVFLDIETTGLDPRRHEILEVGMIMRATDHPGADINLHFSLPIIEAWADEKALEVNRYYEREKELAEIRVDHALGYRLLMTNLRDAVVVGNNVQFDLRFIESYMLAWGEPLRATPWHYHPVDLKALVAGRLGLGAPPWSTKTIAEALQVPLTKDAHSAWADAAWNRDVYDAVMNYQQAKLPNGSVNPPRLHSKVREAIEAGGRA